MYLGGWDWLRVVCSLVYYGNKVYVARQPASLSSYFSLGMDGYKYLFSILVLTVFGFGLMVSVDMD